MNVLSATFITLIDGHLGVVLRDTGACLSFLRDSTLFIRTSYAEAKLIAGQIEGDLLLVFV